MVTAAAEGRTRLPSTVARGLTGAAPPEPEVELSATDRTLLHALCQGLTVATIATHVGYSEREVHRRLRNLYGRLGLRGRADALIFAVRHGLVEPPAPGTERATRQEPDVACPGTAPGASLACFPSSRAKEVNTMFHELTDQLLDLDATEKGVGLAFLAANGRPRRCGCPVVDPVVEPLLLAPPVHLTERSSRGGCRQRRPGPSHEKEPDGPLEDR